MLRIERLLTTLQSRMQESINEIEKISVKKIDTDIESDGWEVNLPWRFSSSDSRYFFNWELTLPKFEDGYDYRFCISTGREGQWDAVNPQILAYINDEPFCGLDTNHRTIALYDNLSGKHIKIGCHLYTGMSEGDLVIRISLQRRSKVIHDAYLDLKVISDVIKALPENALNRSNLKAGVDELINKLTFGPSIKVFKESAERLSRMLWEKFYEPDSKEQLQYTVHAVGHTHIDVAWLWDLKQTAEKVARSYSTALELQNRYPYYKFMGSQPILYEMLESDHPEIFDRVLQATKSGIWESEGAMYLEADCNLSGGESLIRQLEVGQAYFESRFGKKARTLWLPDVFGYSAALPQILKGFDIELFVTSKISWNDTNKLPYDSFVWQGIDGTEIPTQFITTASMETLSKNDHRTIYEGNMSATEVLGCALRNQQRDIQPHAIMPYGFGDGGGGATEDMLETAKRLTAGVAGMPKMKMSSISEYVDALSTVDYSKLPKWRGELYLEYHRGTYTTNGGIKQRFRRLEDLLIQTEKEISLAFMIGRINGKEAVNATCDLEKHWKVLLLNAFHDILPGTSIEKVYEDVYTQLDESIIKVKNICTELGVKSRIDEISGEDEVVEITEDAVYKGKNSETQAILPDELLSTPHYDIAFNELGDLIWLYDKSQKRKVLKSGGFGFRLQAYEDRPLRWDAWDIDLDYKNHMIPWNSKPIMKRIIDNDEILKVEITRMVGMSTIIQNLIFYKHEDEKRIDIECYADWHDHQVLLRAEAELEIHGNSATYDIQFGVVNRPNDANNSYNAAMFEVCAQHWGNMSEGNYNVTLMSNDKFGYSALGSVLGLSLIKSPTWPNPHSDQGEHRFSYALLPEKGPADYVKIHNKVMSGITKTYNQDILEQSQWYSKLPDKLECVSLRILSENVIEMRLCERGNSRGMALIDLPEMITEVWITKLSGEMKQKLELIENTIDLEYSPYELITLRFII